MKTPRLQIGDLVYLNTPDTRNKPLIIYKELKPKPTIKLLGVLESNKKYKGLNSLKFYRNEELRLWTTPKEQAQIY